MNRIPNMKHLVPFAWMLAASTAAAQAPAASSPVPPIQDNSFLVEEAYNQEAGVVQHISTFSRARGGEWAYAFTQEWPLAGQRHQLSYTLPLSRVAAPGGERTGIGDVAVNYRYQIGGAAGSALAFAPRITVLLPTGSSRDGLGAGGMGAQVNLPFSAVLPARLVAHSNVGANYTPRAHDVLGNRAATRGYAVSQSLVWLARPRLNLMLEGAWNRAEEVTGTGRTAWSSELVISPGIRGAIDFPSGLQVVPGLAFPIGVGPSKGERSVFFYLSFEHPFSAAGR
jgi:hypothetical protein